MRRPIPFGKYLMLDRIAVGGMAEVFVAKTFGVEGFERILAIKRILPTMVEDDEFITMFIDEARIAAQLSHANIVQIYELGKHEDSYYIAMEYVSGRDVRSLIEKFRKRQQPVPVGMAVFIAARIAEGLDYAHAKKDGFGQPLGIIHRDISPQNVLVSFDGEVKLIDFGIAKAAGRIQRTQAGILKGKFGYMSPEQVRGLELDHRSDVFSAGVMLYEMLTGAKLFAGESDFSTLEAVRAGDVRKPSELNPNLPPELERVVLKCLAKERDERYQTAGDFHDDLLRFLYSGDEVYSTKRLAGFMREAFADEVRKETDRLRQWWTTAVPEDVAALEEGPFVPRERSTRARSADGKVRIGAPDAAEAMVAEEKTAIFQAPGTEGPDGADRGENGASELGERPTQVKSIAEVLGASDGAPQKKRRDPAPRPGTANGATADPAWHTGEAHAAPATPAPLPVPPAKSRGLGTTIAVLSLILVVGVGLVVKEPVEEMIARASEAEVGIQSQTSGASARLDGEEIPLPLRRRLKEGRYELEVSAAGHETEKRTVDVVRGRPLSLEIRLRPLPAPPVPEPTEAAPVLAAGSERPAPSASAPSGTAPAARVAAPDPRAARPEPAVTAGAPKAAPREEPKQPEAPRPVVVDKRVAPVVAPVAAPVPVEVIGSGRPVAEARNTNGKGAIVVVDSGTGSATVPAVAPTPQPEPLAAVAPPAKARLVALCRPSARVLVNGNDTGRWTPISPSKPLELPAGRHLLTCETADGVRKNEEVSLEPGETFRWIANVDGT